jgi:hypothetical protein
LRVVCFVDIGGIVDHHCLNFPSILTAQTVCFVDIDCSNSLFDGVYRHFQQYFSYIVSVSFNGGGNHRPVASH